MAETFSYKIPAENKLLSFDFSQVLSQGETIVSGVTTVTVHDGTDPSPSSIISGNSSISGTKVSQRIIGGLTGVTYRLVMTIVTSVPNTFVAVGDLPVYSTDLV